MLGLYGGQDKGIPQDQIEAMRQKLAEAGGASKIIVYPDAGHAFYADYRPSYVKADAEASWKEATAWLNAGAGDARPLVYALSRGDGHALLGVVCGQSCRRAA